MVNKDIIHNLLLHSRNVDDMRRSSSDRSQSQMLVENRNFCPQLEDPRRTIAITFGMEKLEW